MTKITIFRNQKQEYLAFPVSDMLNMQMPERILYVQEFRFL